MVVNLLTFVFAYPSPSLIFQYSGFFLTTVPETDTHNISQSNFNH